MSISLVLKNANVGTAGSVSRLVQPQECIIPTKADKAVVKCQDPHPPNITMTLIFSQGLWISPLIIIIDIKIKYRA